MQIINKSVKNKGHKSMDNNNELIIL